MLRTLDRYVIRETLAPFCLALAVFTFVLAVRPMLDAAQDLLAKGIPLSTVGYLLVVLLPQSLGLTIPMAFLAGVLMALGRLSGDREAVALLACGVSPLRLLRPVLIMAVAVAALDMYVMVQLLPDGNQRYREVTYGFLAKQTETDVKPGMFYQRLPGKVLYVRALKPGGGWLDVFLADTSQPGRPTVTLAEEARLVLDEPNKKIDLYLLKAHQYSPGADPSVYDLSTNDDGFRISVAADDVFGPPSRGFNEMYIPDLQRTIALMRSNGQSPHNAIFSLHQKFSFPVACLIFAVIGVAAGIHTRKEGKLGGMTVGLVVVFLYYTVMDLAESSTKGQRLPAEWARWIPNLLFGVVGALGLWWRIRNAGTRVSISLPALLARWTAARSVPATPTTSTSPTRPVVVIRIPQIPLPRPRLLDMYVTSRYLRVLALTCVGLLAIYYIATANELSDKVMKGQASSGTMLWYLWYSTPQFIQYFVPIATLLAVLATIGGLTRSSELTVMRACGISLYRAALPLVLFGALWSGALFVLQERVTVPANARAQELRDDLYDAAPALQDASDRSWLAGPNGRIYYYLTFTNPTGQPPTLHRVSAFETVGRPYRLASHTYADRATFTRGRWQGEQGWIQRFREGEVRVRRQSFTRAPVIMAPPPEFAAANVKADQMTYGELQAYITRLADSGFSVAYERVRLQSKLAFPLVTVIMTLLAVPFGVTVGKRGALYGTGLAIVLAVAYFLLAAFFMAAGSAGVLPAALAAWATNLFFLALAVYLLLTART